MRSARLSAHEAVIALGVSLGLVLGGCGVTSGSRLTTGAPPSSTSTEPAPSTSAGPITVATAIAGTATAGPASTVNAAPAASEPPTTSPRPPQTPPPTLPPPAPVGGGVYGYVTAGPTCPVERPGQPCPPRPVTAHIQAQDQSGRNVAAAESDGSGRYLLSLPQGTYSLTATADSTYPRCQPAQVIVRAGTPTRADLSCDTGIR